MSRQPYALHQRLLAWSVHVFTATGMLAGFAAIIAITRSDWRSAGIWLLVGLIIDGVDGTFARLWKVSEVLPHVQGKIDRLCH
jgi:phosphatidylcholine synthase